LSAPVSRTLLVDCARGVVELDPAQEFGDRRAVARLRRLVAVDLDPILDRLGQHHGIARIEDRRPRGVERLRDRRHRALGIDRDGLARQRAKEGLERVALVEANPVAEVGADLAVDLFAGDEQVGGAVGVDDRIGQGDRGVGDVGAALDSIAWTFNVRGEHRRIGFLLDQPVGDVVAFLRRGLARQFFGLDDEPRRRWLGAVGPHLVDRIVPDRDQLGALVLERGGRRLDPVAAVQPRIIADPRAVGGVGGKPRGDARLRHRLEAPLARRDLLPDLDRVAPVGEDRGFLGQHRRRPRRALEAGQPFEPLGIAADIFAHMLVGQRHHEAVEAVAFQLVAEGGKAIGMAGHKQNS
jgi:hypothetical protein